MISALCCADRNSFIPKPKFYASYKPENAVELQSSSDDNKEMDVEGEDLPDDLNMDNYDNEKAAKDALATGADDLAEAIELNMQIMDGDSVPEEDQEDYIINDTDRIILVANAGMGDEVSTLEVQIYDDSTGNLFIHHDITLPNFPLSLCHLQRNVQDKNTVAVGTFGSNIEIWDLDIINVLEPIGQLGINLEDSKSSTTEFTHREGVLSLDYSHLDKTILASGSADKDVRIWDLNEFKGMNKYSFSDKLLSVMFSPAEKNILIGACFTGSTSIIDFRTSQTEKFVLNAKGDITALTWSEHNPFQFLCGTENGSVLLRDMRKLDTTVVKYKAHKSGCTAFSFNKVLTNMFATCSEDMSVKLWDITKLDGNKYKSNQGFIHQKEMALGKIFDVSFDIDSPHMLAAGGEQGILGIWDFGEEDFYKTFTTKLDT